jgi:type IV secretion system protein VirB3
MDDQDGSDPDTLAVALTRPTTKLGVPYSAIVINLLVCVEALSLTSNLLCLVMYVPLHGICYLITLNDPRAFELLLLWGRTKLATLLASRWYWSVSTYSPLAFRERPGVFKRWRLKRRLHRETPV